LGRSLLFMSKEDPDLEDFAIGWLGPSTTRCSSEKKKKTFQLFAMKGGRRLHPGPGDRTET